MLIIEITGVDQKSLDYFHDFFVNLKSTLKWQIYLKFTHPYKGTLFTQCLPRCWHNWHPILNDKLLKQGYCFYPPLYFLQQLKACLLCNYRINSIYLFKLFVESLIKFYWFYFDVATIQLIFITVTITALVRATKITALTSQEICLLLRLLLHSLLSTLQPEWAFENVG